MLYPQLEVEFDALVAAMAGAAAPSQEG
jgi:hypothetical protein